jgi:hypothetical protein
VIDQAQPPPGEGGGGGGGGAAAAVLSVIEMMKIRALEKSPEGPSSRKLNDIEMTFRCTAFLLSPRAMLRQLLGTDLRNPVSSGTRGIGRSVAARGRARQRVRNEPRAAEATSYCIFLRVFTVCFAFIIATSSLGSLDRDLQLGAFRIGAFLTPSSRPPLFHPVDFTDFHRLSTRLNEGRKRDPGIVNHIPYRPTPSLLSFPPFLPLENKAYLVHGAEGSRQQDNFVPGLTSISDFLHFPDRGKWSRPHAHCICTCCIFC